MKQNRGYLMAVLLLLTALACVVPGLQPASAIPPTPDTRLDVMVAETVAAALTLTQQVPTATITSTPTPTSTPTSTPLPVEPTKAEESVLDENTDGTSSFIDMAAKYQFTVPVAWLPLRINSPEYDEAVLLPEASNPAIQNQLSVIQKQDPNVFRLFMLDINEEHIDSGFVSNVNLVWDSQMEISVATDSDLKGLAATLPTSLKDAKVTNVEIKTTAGGLSYGVITATTPLMTQEGARLNVYQKLVFFDLPTGTLTATLSTTEKWQSTVEPSFDEFVESFLLLE
ncbi:MAG: hypothetical protein U0X74_04975 [Anaerolineales bacterium]